MADQLLSAAPSSQRAHDLTASVALATYDGSAFIRAQLDSILTQSELPDEIVITDDQSQDDTCAIIAEYAGRSPIPIHLHRNPDRLGFARNFMKAIGLCRSDIIFLCDQDDVWRPNKVARMKAAFADPTVFLAYHGALVVTVEGTPLYQLYDADQQRAKLAAEPMDPWYAPYGLTQAFRAPLRVCDDLWERSLNHVHAENEPLAHDQWYHFLAQIFGRVDFIAESFVNYRQHGANAVGASHHALATDRAQRFRQQFSHDPRQDRLQSDAAHRRAEILDEISHRTDSAVAERSRAVAQCYRSLAMRLQRRHSTYISASLWKRATSLGRMVMHSDYGHHPWGFNKRSILRDAIAGVMTGRSAGSEKPIPAANATSPLPTREPRDGDNAAAGRAIP